ncbi:MAG: CBS domain-containing protein [Nitrospirae bacterium]|nr:CBS domain-containing protein [Nitrospirota bacterium]MBI3353238.1 CBS domain-containing protein [Nitrospirota bacterium]
MSNGSVYVSELLGIPVLDQSGEEIGRVKDFFIAGGEIFPKVSSILYGFRKDYILPWEMVLIYNRRFISTKVSKSDRMPVELTRQEILIKRDILDKQIVDIHGAKVVRVNDLELQDIKGTLSLTSADVGVGGILRRLLGGKTREWWRKKFDEKGSKNLISWAFVGPIQPQLRRLELNISRQKVAQLLPQDIAHIMEQVSMKERELLFKSLDKNTAARTLSELDPDTQVKIVEKMDRGEASDILEIMPPDEAADVLGDLSEKSAQQIIQAMEKEEAAELQELLEHQEDTAGGMMTTEVFTVSPDFTCDEAILKIKETGREVETIYYLYVIDEQSTLLGICSLRDLLLSRWDQKISVGMTTHIKFVAPHSPQREVASLISKYNLLAIPVLDEEKKLLGIVTVDDVVDLLMSYYLRNT